MKTISHAERQRKSSSTTDMELSVNALCVANETLHKLIDENPDLTCDTIASNPAGDYIKAYFEAAFRGKGPQSFIISSNTNGGGDYSSLHSALEKVPRTLKQLEANLDAAIGELKPEIPGIIQALKENREFITSGKVLSPNAYAKAIDDLKTDVLNAARNAKLIPDVIDVDSSLPARR